MATSAVVHQAMKEILVLVVGTRTNVLIRRVALVLCVKTYQAVFDVCAHQVLKETRMYSVLVSFY